MRPWHKDGISRCLRAVHQHQFGFSQPCTHSSYPYPPLPSAGPCQVHGEGCSTLIHHKPDVSRVFGIYLMEAGIIFHSGALEKRVGRAWLKMR